MYGKLQQQLQKDLNNIKEEGLYKDERVIMNPQGALIKVSTGEEVLNFCANNYLGLSSGLFFDTSAIIIALILLGR